MAAMLCTNHSWPFEKAYTPIYQTFRMFSLHIDAPSHTFSLMADCNVCLSLAGGLMRQNLFLEFVRDAIDSDMKSSFLSTVGPHHGYHGAPAW